MADDDTDRRESDKLNMHLIIDGSYYSGLQEPQHPQLLLWLWAWLHQNPLNLWLSITKNVLDWSHLTFCDYQNRQHILINRFVCYILGNYENGLYDNLRNMTLYLTMWNGDRSPMCDDHNTFIFIFKIISWVFFPFYFWKWIDMKGGERWRLTRSKGQQVGFEPYMQDSANTGRTLLLGELEVAPRSRYLSLGTKKTVLWFGLN